MELTNEQNEAIVKIDEKGFRSLSEEVFDIEVEEGVTVQFKESVAFPSIFKGYWNVLSLPFEDSAPYFVLRTYGADPKQPATVAGETLEYLYLDGLSEDENVYDLNEYITDALNFNESLIVTNLPEGNYELQTEDVLTIKDNGDIFLSDEAGIANDNSFSLHAKRDHFKRLTHYYLPIIRGLNTCRENYGAIYGATELWWRG